MKNEGIRLIAAPTANGARDRRGNAAAHGAGGNHLHQHHAGKHQRHAGECIGAEAGDKVGLDQPGHRLREHHQHVRRSEP